MTNPITSISEKSLVVLPFKNLSGDNSYEYFSDGITEEIINALTKIKDLKVTARTSSFAFKNKPTDIRIIGNELGVTNAVEGSVKIAKERIRISAQLTRTDNGFLLWSEKFDRKMDDVFELQDEISLLIADKIRENFGHIELSDSLIESPKISTWSYQEYLKAKSLIAQFNKQDILTGIAKLKGIVAENPHFALAQTHIHYAYNMMAAGGLMPVKEAFEIGDIYLNNAHELDGDLPEVYHSLGWNALNKQWDFRKAVSYLFKALELRPNYADAHQKLFITLILEGNLVQADHHINRAHKLDPLSDLNNYFMAYNCYINRDHEKTLFYFKRCFSINNKFLVGYGIYALALLEQKNETAVWLAAEQIPEMDGANTERLLMQTLALSFKGEYNEHLSSKLDELNKLMQTGAQERVRFFMVYMYTFLKDYEKAFDLIDQGIERKEPLMTLLKVDPLLSQLPKNDRFQNQLNTIFELANTEQQPTESIAKRLLSDTELQSVKKALIEKMEKEKVYTEPLLNLRALADKLNLSANQLSWALNFGFQKNFNDFVNTYRLEHFQKLALLPENAHLTLLGLAYDSGFNSKTVFNTYFKKVVGKTPKQWLRNNG